MKALNFLVIASVSSKELILYVLKSIGLGFLDAKDGAKD